MRVLKYNYRVRANIAHVFKCHRDIDFICKTINETGDTSGLKAKRKGDEIHFFGPEILAIAKEVEAVQQTFLKFEITPVSEKLVWYGSLFAICGFRENGEETVITTEITSDKNPNLFVKGLIKLVAWIFRFQSRKHENQIIEAIEECA
jgi:hypothetical protein